MKLYSECILLFSMFSWRFEEQQIISQMGQTGVKHANLVFDGLCHLMGLGIYLNA